MLRSLVGSEMCIRDRLLGERYPAEKAYADGLVTRLVEDEDLEKVTDEIALKFANGPPLSFRMIRQMTWAALDSSFAEELALERVAQRTAGRTDDFIEGVSSFREKRKANFTGN